MAIDPAELTPETFEAIRRALAGPARPLGPENRRFDRHQPLGGMTVVLDPPGRRAYLIDYSRDGVGLVAASPLTVGRMVDVRVYLSGEAPDSATTSGQVVSCVRVSEGLYRVGIAFDGMNGGVNRPG